MVLVSFALVVVAAITLVIGLLQSGLGIIYVSIACSVLAGIVLFVAVLRGRPEPRAAGAPGEARPAPAGAPPPPPPAPADTSWQPSTPAPAPVGARGDGEAEAEAAAAPTPPPSPPPPSRRERVPLLSRRRSGEAAATDAGVGDRTEQLDQAAIEDAVAIDEPAPAATDAGFPIHNYDKLRATEILPMLADLDDEQLEAVRSREESGKNRFMILSRIDDEVQARSSDSWDADDQWEGEPEPVGEPVDAGGPGPVPVSRRAATGEFPIPDYDSLRALDVLGRLNDLSPGELQQVREREQSGGRRAMVLNRIDRILEETGPLPAEPLVGPPPEPAPAPARGRGRGRAAAAPVAKKAGGRAAKAAKATRAAKVVAPEPDAAPVKRAAGAKKARVKKVADEAPPIPTKRAGVKRGAPAGAGPESAAPAKRAAKAGTAKKTVAAKKAVKSAKKAVKVPGAVKKTARKR